MRRHLLLLTLPLLLAALPAAAELPLHLARTAFDPLVESPSFAEGWMQASPQEPGLLVVQFSERLGAEHRSALLQRGWEPLGYLPEQALLVAPLKPGLPAASLATLPDLRWIEPLHPEWKVASPLLERWQNGQDRLDPVVFQLLVAPRTDYAQLSATLGKWGLTVQDIWDRYGERTVLLSGELGHLPMLARHPAVLWVQERPQYRLFNSSVAWVAQSDTEEEYPLWERGLLGQGQMLGVLDSGLDYAHCSFRDPQVDRPGPRHRKVEAYRQYGGDEYDACVVGHGTHVVGTAIGKQLGSDKDEIRGIAPEARVTFGDVGTSDVVGCLFGALIINKSLSEVFTEAKQDGAFIHTNSWGSLTSPYDAGTADLDRFVANNPDFLVLFANGNEGPGPGTVGTPANAKNLLGVGSALKQPEQAKLANYSSRGPTTDGRMKPNVCISGTGTVSARSSGQFDFRQSCDTLSISGTSMATPAMAGAALLLRQYFTDGYYPSGSPEPLHAHRPSSALMRAVLHAASRAMSTGERLDSNQGWGYPVLDDALYFPGDEERLFVAGEVGPGLDTGQSHSYEITVTKSASPLRINLAWTDAPGLPLAGKALVNDLDLRVYGPDGGVYLGNDMNASWSLAGGAKPDRLNNEEGVALKQALPGTYRVEVFGHQVPEGSGGSQHYALVVVGHLAEDSVPPITGLPAAPFNLAARDTPDDEGGSVSLTWNLSMDDATGGGGQSVTGYTVLRRAVNEARFSALASVPAGTASYADTTTRDGLGYHYRVRGNALWGFGNESNEVGPVTSVRNRRGRVAVALAGYVPEGGRSKLLAITTAREGATASAVRVHYEGRDTGLALAPESAQGGDGLRVFGYLLPELAGIEARLMLELRPAGASVIGPLWPYLTVE